MIQENGKFIKSRNAFIIEKEPVIFHCHHYNCYLQAVILDTVAYLPKVPELLIKASHEITYSQFNNYFRKSHETNYDTRKKIVERYFKFCGFGLINLDLLTNKGGLVKTSSEHYGIGWVIKFKPSKTPVSFFTRGFLTGAFEAIYDHPPGTFSCSQERCLGMGDQESIFEIKLSKIRNQLSESPGEGEFQEGTLIQPSGTTVDYNAIRNALTEMSLEGSDFNGLIDAFGVYLTRHYANYYCNISYRFLHLFKEKMGADGLDMAKSLLIEAGHVCGVHTFGGIMQSNEWHALVKPMLKTKEDWVHGVIAVANAFGWGFWEVTDLIPDERLELKITSGYESNSYLKSYGRSDFTVSFLATGGVAGLMNLVYNLDLPNKIPLTLDEVQYNGIVNDNRLFHARQIKCRAMGAEYDIIEVTR